MIINVLMLLGIILEQASSSRTQYPLAETIHHDLHLNPADARLTPKPPHLIDLFPLQKKFSHEQKAHAVNR